MTPTLIAASPPPAVAGGAAAIRANGPAASAPFAHHTCAIIGIQKFGVTMEYFLSRDFSESAKALVEAGADMVALDCTAADNNQEHFDVFVNSTPAKCPVLADVARLRRQSCSAGRRRFCSIYSSRVYEEPTMFRTLTLIYRDLFAMQTAFEFGRSCARCRGRVMLSTKRCPGAPLVRGLRHDMRPYDIRRCSANESKSPYKIRVKVLNMVVSSVYREE